MIITIITTIPTTTISIIKMTTTITTNATIAIDTTNGIDTPSPSLLPIRPSPPPQYHYTTTTNTHTTTTLTNTTTTTTATNLCLSFPQHPLITNDDEFSSTHNSYVQLPDLSQSQQLVISRQSLHLFRPHLLMRTFPAMRLETHRFICPSIGPVFPRGLPL